MKFFTSATRFEAIKKESMEWEIICPSCTKTTSIWEIGGVRYKAKGTPKMRIKCPKCDENVTAQLLHNTNK